METFYTIRPKDVGRQSITAFGRRWLVQDFIGHIMKIDVGKRVYRRGDILQVENDEQRNRRLGIASNPRLKLPSKFTPAEVRVNEQGKVQIRINPAKLGSGGRFAKCVESVTAKGGAVDPRAVCAAAGRKKYGAKKFAAMAKAGRKRQNPASHYLRGWVAIQFAEKHGVRYVSKYADPIEDAKARVTIERAKKIAREDPRLIYLRTSKSMRLSK